MDPIFKLITLIVVALFHQLVACDVTTMLVRAFAKA